MESNQPHSESSVTLPEGDRTQWLVKHQPWLRVLAAYEMHQRLNGKFDPSDVVQQTMLEAWQGWEGVQAEDEAQRKAWLRQVLVHQLARFIRRYEGTAKRNVTRELSIDQSLNRSAQRLDALLAVSEGTPSCLAIAKENREQLWQALDCLSEDYRQVILLRSIEELSHKEVAARMGRSEAAVRMLWVRALAALTSNLS